jgi:Zn-finger nucleic acid-binding protein
MGRVYIGATHCQHCGAEVNLGARSDLDAPSVRKCPRCLDAALGAHLVGETLVDECPRCSGLWIDRESFERLIKDREAMAVVDGLDAPRVVDLDAFQAAPPSLGPVVYIPCPDCGELMNRKNFAQRSGVILDVCRPHGVWFDADELGKVIAFVLRGGLDEAKRREAEEVKRRMLERRAQGARDGKVLELDVPASAKVPKLVDVFLDGVISLLFG